MHTPDLSVKIACYSNRNRIEEMGIFVFFCQNRLPCSASKITFLFRWHQQALVCDPRSTMQSVTNEITLFFRPIKSLVTLNELYE